MPASRADPVKPGSQVELKSMQKRWQKGGAKVEAKRQQITALNPNLLAPAQSKHCLSLSGKTRNSKEKTSIPAPFFYTFAYIFKQSQEKSQKVSRVPPQSLKKTPKLIPRVPKRSPKMPKLSPKVPPSNKKNDTCIPRVSKWSPKCYNGVLRSPKVQKNTKRSPEV